MIAAIDPGDKLSALVVYDENTGAVKSSVIDLNEVIRDRLRSYTVKRCCRLLVEYTPPYTLQRKKGGAFVPNQVALTAIEIGRFVQSWEHISRAPWELVSRMDVKKALLGRTTGNDADIRQAILARYGGTRETAVGKQSAPGPLFGVKRDSWAALAVALAWMDSQDGGGSHGGTDD